MAFGNNSTSADSLLKEFYSPDYVNNLCFKKNVLWGIIKKSPQQNATGRYVYSVLKYFYGQSASATFSNAQAAAALTGEGYFDFNVPLVEDFAVAQISSKIISQTKTDRGSFLKLSTDIIDGQMQNFANRKSIQLYRGASGSRGQISASATIASSSLLLSNIADAKNFEIGMELDLATSEVSGSKEAYGSAGHGLYVTKVNRRTGVLTIGTTPTAGGTACNISDATNGIPTAATSMYVYVAGDRNNIFSGLEDWNPQSAPGSSDSFMGSVNRSYDEYRMSGLRLDATTSGATLLSTLEQAGSMVNEQGGELTHFMMPYKQFLNLSLELGAKVQLVEVSSTAQVGYTGIKVATGDGFVVCLPDRCCPPNRIMGVNVDSMELCTVGEPVGIWDADGQGWLRTATQSGMEVRLYSFSAFRLLEPLNFINIKVTP